MIYSPLIEQLIKALRCLPGVGIKSAQRLAFHLLEKDRQGGVNLVNAINNAFENIRQCQRCNILCETELCQICTSTQRNSNLLCVTESPTDVLAIEQSNSFKGLYFVLTGHLSPIDGIGPKEIGIDKLQTRLQNDDIHEIILATNPTVEGEATAHYIAEIARKLSIKTSRIAYGVPVGGELEYVDVGTLARAIQGREVF